jgi:hypothetical protein
MEEAPKVFTRWMASWIRKTVRSREGILGGQKLDLLAVRY